MLGRPTPLETPSALGKKVLQELYNNDIIKVHNDDNCLGQPAVLTSEEFDSLKNLTDEHHVVAFMTPIFERLLSGNIQVVNSEQYAWLETGSSAEYDKRPDVFFCHSAIYESRPPFDTKDEELLGLRRESDEYGVLADWRLRDCIDVIGQAKKKIGHDSIGQVVNYARHVCFQHGAPKYVKLLLYDKQEFWLLRATNGDISQAVRCKWKSHGGREILRAFLEDGRSPWIKLLIAACEHWNLEVQRDSFLGKGAFGRVFKVASRQEGRTLFHALKIVLPGDDGCGGITLQKEYHCLKNAAHFDGVAQVKDFHRFDGGAAMLLTDVGRAVEKPFRKKLFETLGHLHEQNVVHGDARLPNAIVVETEVQWIDFFASFVAGPPSLEAKRHDLKTLIRSCYDEGFFDHTGADQWIEEYIEEYNGTEAEASKIHDMIFAGPICSKQAIVLE